METTATAQAKVCDPPPLPRRRIALRALIVFVALFFLGFGMRRLSAGIEQSRVPAGFYHGLLHGALMPAAWPNLIIGKDVMIYAPLNTGLTYKLGYTVGVNVCGAIFFGIFFWRVNRWRKGRRET